MRFRLVSGILLFGLVLVGRAPAQTTPPAQDYVGAIGTVPLRAPATAAFSPGGSFTLEAWVYLTGATPYGWLMGKGLATSGTDPYVSFALQLDGTGTKLLFATSTGASGSYHELAAPNALPLRTWTHVAAVLENGATRLLINGQQVASGTSAGAPLVANDVPFGVGIAYLANGGTNYSAFPGYARQVRLWSVARSAAQIAAALGQSLPMDRTGLVGAWPLDESSGTTAHDASGNGRDLAGGSWVRRAVLEAGPFFSVTNQTPANTALAEVDDGILIDFDNDGDLDLVTTHIRVPPTVPETRVRLHAFRNDNGTFTDATDSVLGNVTMVHPRHRWVADFNGDGRADLLIVGHGTDTLPFPGEQAKLFIQSSDGRLVDETAARLPSHLSFTHNVAVGDIDGDGDLDLYMANINGGANGPLFYVNNGSGVFTDANDRLPADIAAKTNGRAYTSAALVDLTGDGRPELVLGGESTTPNEILVNDGTGHFARDSRYVLPGKLFGDNAVTVAVTSADLNADGASDLLLSTTGGSIALADGRTIYGYGIAGVQLLLGRGDGTFTDATSQLNLNFNATTDTWVEWIRVADLNGDGRPDLVLQGAPNATGQAFSRTILLNAGNGVFVDASDALSVGTVTFLQPGDVNRDGIMDLVGVGNSIVVARGLKTLDLATFRPSSGAPAVATSPASTSASAGGGASLAVAGNGPSASYQWEQNGRNLAGATSATLTLASVQPAQAGVYRAWLGNAAGSVASDFAILGVSASAKVVGTGEELQPVNIRHPNGNTFDQVLLTGSAETITADFAENQITRTSFIDLNGDIVQVEFGGPGSLSLVLDNASGPAAPANYTQQVNYMRGHAGIVITGADERTNVSVFTVGRATAFDPTGNFNILQPIGATNDPANNGSSLFVGQGATNYDGLADIAFIAIATTNGKFGGVRTSNTRYYATRGLTGIYAPGVAFQGPVFVGDIAAFDAATPVLVLGSASDTRVTGGDMLQDNGQAVQVSGVAQLKFTAGGDSHGRTLTAQNNRGVFRQNGADVTSQIVVNPSP